MFISIFTGSKDILSTVSSGSVIKFLFSESAAIKNIKIDGTNKMARINFK